MKIEEEYQSHAILLNGGAVLAVCITKSVAVDLCECCYGANFKEKGIRIVLSENKHIQELM